MGTKLLEKDTCMELGKRMFNLVSAKVLQLEAESSSLDTFVALAKEAGLDEVDLLWEGFMRECGKHFVSRNEAEHLFANSKYFVVKKMRSFL
jgi:hypothetical protein